MSGNLLLELGQVEKAQQCLGRAIFVLPDSGHSKYLTAAQLFTGTDARDLYIKGVDLLRAAVESAPGAVKSDAAGEMSTAFVALSELYMTDLCDLEEAETEARRFIDLALEVDGTNPEAHQGLASFLMVVGDMEKAAEALDRSLQLWLPDHLAWSATGEGQQTSLSYNTRLGTVKLLLDLEHFDKAGEILDTLLEEDDEVVAPWYLHGWLNYLRNDPDYHGNVRHYLSKAQQVHTMNPTDDVAMVEHIEELLAEVEAEAVVQPQETDNLDYTEEDSHRAETIAGILDKEMEEDQEAMED